MIEHVGDFVRGFPGNRMAFRKTVNVVTVHVANCYIKKITLNRLQSVTFLVFFRGGAGELFRRSRTRELVFPNVGYVLRLAAFLGRLGVVLKLSTYVALAITIEKRMIIIDTSPREILQLRESIATLGV